MSMDLVLEGVQEWLREKYSWANNQCAVQYNAEPTVDSGQFFVGIDDAGVEESSGDTDCLAEIFSIQIGIWRRPEHIVPDRRGKLKLNTDKWLLGAKTLASLEQKIKIHNSGQSGKNGLHRNYAFKDYLNSYWSLPSSTQGSIFVSPLIYGGRTRMETVGLLDGSNPKAFYGYRLRFRGLLRTQKLRSADDAIG